MPGGANDMIEGIQGPAWAGADIAPESAAMAPARAASLAGGGAGWESSGASLTRPGREQCGAEAEAEAEVGEGEGEAAEEEGGVEEEEEDA